MTIKTVWLVGAGISKEAGYPLVSDFLNPSYFEGMIIRSNFPEGITNRIIPKFQKFSSAGQDLNTLMAHYLEIGDTKSSEELNRLILLALDEARWFLQDNYNLPYIHAFGHQLGASESSVISFNYDTLIEELITFLYADCFVEQHFRYDPEPVPYSLELGEGNAIRMRPERGLLDFGAGFLSAEPPSQGRLKILKIHGSSCLMYCRNCNTTYYSPPPNKATHYVNFEIGTTGTHPCVRCKKETEFALLFVPPASDERFPTWKLLDHLWLTAKEELLSSNTLVIAGYSLPNEDKRARRLLSTVAELRPGLKVLVVDPFLSNNLRQRFTSIFPQARFLKASFRQLMGMITTLKTKESINFRKGLNPEIEELLVAMVGPQAARQGGALPGAIPLHVDLDDCLNGDEMTWDYRIKAIAMLGLSSLSVFQDRIAQEALDGDNKNFSGLCAQSLGSFANQEAVDALSLLVGFTEPFEIDRSTPMAADPGAIIFPQSIATFALVGLREAIFQNPFLDYDEAAAAVAVSLLSGTMMEIDQFSASATLRIIDNLERLRQKNRN